MMLHRKQCPTTAQPQMQVRWKLYLAAMQQARHLMTVQQGMRLMTARQMVCPVTVLVTVTIVNWRWTSKRVRGPRKLGASYFSLSFLLLTVYIHFYRRAMRSAKNQSTSRKDKAPMSHISRKRKAMTEPVPGPSNTAHKRQKV